jgi:hypothetical protein
VAVDVGALVAVLVTEALGTSVGLVVADARNKAVGDAVGVDTVCEIAGSTVQPTEVNASRAKIMPLVLITHP